MKKLFTVGLCVLMLASCSDQLTETNPSMNQTPVNQDGNEYQYYLEKARWGDANAYQKLADFYRTGVGVKADFIGMTAMLSMAEQYNRDLRVDDYLMALPEEDGFKRLFNTMDELKSKDMDKVKSTASALIADGKPEGYVIRGAMLIEEGDTLGGLETIRYGADQGSSFGELILHMSPAFLYNNRKPFDAPGLIRMAEQHPFAYKFLAEMYAGEVCDSVYDPEQAARYYLKADEYGFLGRKGAKWLLDYYTREGIQIDDLEKQRLKTLCGDSDNDDIATGDIPIVYQEQSIQEYVDSVTHYRMLTDECKRAIVYVVETETGKIIAHSSLEDTGNHVIPFEDSFNRENDYMHGVATYLAVQLLCLQLEKLPLSAEHALEMVSFC